MELHKVDQDPSLLPQAEAIANAAIAILTTPGGILTEWTVSGTDAPLFKDVFMSNLMALSHQQVSKAPNTRHLPKPMPTASGPTIKPMSTSSVLTGRDRSTQPTPRAQAQPSTR